MFPKIKSKKRRKKHPPSILHKKDGTCYLCMRLLDNYSQYRIVHEHHVYPGNPNRRISEENGFKVYLCPGHHEFTMAAVKVIQDYSCSMTCDKCILHDICDEEFRECPEDWEL